MSTVNHARTGLGVLIPPPLIYAAFLALGIYLDYKRPTTLLPDILRYPLGFALIAIGIGITPSVFRAFRAARTSLNPRRSPRVLVTSGPYRFSRNPGYLAAALLYAGIGITLDNPWILVLLIPVLLIMHFAVILPEERHLEETFGREYRIYKKRVRRWI